MYLEHFQLHSLPFREEVDPKVFFPEAGRQAVLQGLRDDLKKGRLLIKLIGNEGAGKTLMCKVFLAGLPELYETLYLDNPSGSFDELLSVICLDLGMKPESGATNRTAELKKLIQHRKEKGRKIILVLDGAEQIYLATLERLLRLVCELEASSIFTLMLSGRPGLDDNLEQLTVYCSDIDIHQGYFLEPMTLQETGRYLTFRLLAAGLSPDKQQDVFTGEAVQKIFATAKGNPRLTNILAEEALQKSCSDKSFMVLLDHVGHEEKPVGVAPNSKDILQIFQKNKRRLALGAGAAVILLTVMLLFFRQEKPEQMTNSAGTQSSGGPATVTIEQPVEKPEGDDLPQTTKPGGKPSISELKVVDSIGADSPSSPTTGVGNGEKEAENEVDLDTPRNGKELFQERLRANANWIAGAYRNEYTIQLMMLSSGNAAENVEKLLVQDEYFAIRDKLHILRKKTTPPTLFVFYGTYSSMDSARQARNQMPIFLRKHHPYALSIADALTKTED